MKDRLLTILITANLIIGVFFLFGEDEAEAKKPIHQKIANFSPTPPYKLAILKSMNSRLKSMNSQGYTATSISCFRAGYDDEGCYVVLTK